MFVYKQYMRKMVSVIPNRKMIHINRKVQTSHKRILNFLEYVINNDTVLNGFIWIYLKMKPDKSSGKIGIWRSSKDTQF